MSTSAFEISKSRSPKLTPWWEMAIAILLYLILGMAFPALKQLLALPLFIYMILDSWLRHRSWADNGFDIRHIFAGLRQTLGWFLLVAFGTQALFVLGEYFFLPGVLAHIIARIPYSVASLNVGFFISLAIATFLEELIFRAFFQNRLSAYLSPAVAIGLVSLVFTLAHASTGPVLVVFIDLLSVFVDSLIYGIIFQRSKNVFVSWLPHFLADVVGIIFLVLLK